MILSGTVERYSNIKFILAHSGGTLPYINWRISEAVNTEKYIMEAPAQRLKSFITSSKKKLLNRFYNILFNMDTCLKHISMHFLVGHH